LEVRLAALDVGSNSCHITVARLTKRLSNIERLADEADLVGLGTDVYTHDAIGPERMERACATIRKQVEMAHACGAQTILGIATEAVRVARNGSDFIDRVWKETGVRLQLVTGEQEAALTYWGATSGLRGTRVRRAVLDMGGGSLEFAVGTGCSIEWRVSLPLGSRTVSHLYVPSDPPTVAELERVRTAVARSLDRLVLPTPVEEAIVCGGTAKTLATLGTRLLPAYRYSPPRKVVPRDRYLSRGQLEIVLAMLETASAAEVSQRFGIDEGRARLLAPGGAVLLASMDRLGVSFLRSRRRGVREGAMLTYARCGERWLDIAANGTHGKRQL
jgi:exopolyphosphatase/guanosine-5'-triphosphate,3'-diphosphate pyrophosphatase